MKKPLVRYKSAAFFFEVEVTAVRPIPAETCKRLHAVPASFFFFAKLSSFGAKSVKIAYFLRIFNDFVIQILILTFVVDFGAILGSYIFRPK